jgi:hypothetical protein
MVLLLTVNVPLVLMPPPEALFPVAEATLLKMVLLATVNAPLLLMPPPAVLFPPVMVSPLMLAPMMPPATVKTV